MQLDTGADRTILAKIPPGAKISGQGCINGKDVDLFQITAFIPDTSCAAQIEVAVAKKRGDLPVVIGADFFQGTNAVLDYRGHLIGCPRGKAPEKGFAGSERTGLLRFTKGRCVR